MSPIHADAVLKRSFRIWSRNLPTFLGLTFIVFIPQLLILAYHVANIETVVFDEGAMRRWRYLDIVAWLVLGPVAAAVMMHGVLEQLRGRPVPFADSLRQGLRRALPVIGVGVVSGIVIGLGFLLLVIPGLLLMPRLFVATPAAVVEKTGVVASIGRSEELTRGSVRPVFAVAFGLAVLSFLTGMAIVLVLGDGATPQEVANTSIAMELTSIVWSSLSAVAAVVVYNDLRLAKDGLDTEQLAAVFD